ncbi:MAG: class I SAM-dependent methyltransferase [Phycisphaerae bacterium]|nr:class I SAM-dependent methyltransferase [Phycisphaerae bacterium]
MEPVENQTQLRYEKRWQNAIAAGIEQAGNLDLNLLFLEQTGLLTPDKNSLELGCGVGLLVLALYQKGLTIIGSDISQTAIDHAREKFPGLDFRVFSAEKIPCSSDIFDLVLSFDVIEHLHDVDCHFREVRRILKPGGHYLFQTPNKLTNVIFETLKSRSFYWRIYHPSLHYYGQLHRRLQRHGFSSKFIKMNTMNAYTLTKLSNVGLPQSLFRWIDFRRLPYRMQTNFFVIAEKQPESSFE